MLHPGLTEYLSHHQWGVHLFCTPQALAPLHTSAPPSPPHSWGTATSPCHLGTAQRRGHWGGGPPRPGEFRSRHPSVGLQAGKDGGLAREQNSKSKLCGCEVGLPSWTTPPRGDQIGQTSRPINELWARTNEDKGKNRQRRVMGKDGQGWVTGKDGQGQVMGKGKEGQGQ